MVLRLIANWLSERRYFWDFVRPACIGSARQSSKYFMDIIILIFIFIYIVIERVEEVSKMRSIKYKVDIIIKILFLTSLIENDLCSDRSILFLKNFDAIYTDNLLKFVVNFISE